MWVLFVEIFSETFILPFQMKTKKLVIKGKSEISQVSISHCQIKRTIKHFNFYNAHSNDYSTIEFNFFKKIWHTRVFACFLFFKHIKMA